MLTVLGEGEGDADGLPLAFELELLAGSSTQPAPAKVARAIISPRVVCLIVFILEYLGYWVTVVYRRNRPLTQAVLTFAYFASGVLALGEGDAAGVGLAAGLGLFTGALDVALGAGDVAAAGLAVFGEVELSPGSVAQAAANMIEHIVRSRSAVRLMMFMFGVFISFCLVRARLKSRTMIARALICSNECSHRSFRGISARSTQKPSFSKRACTINERARQPAELPAVPRLAPADGISATFAIAGRG